MAMDIEEWAGTRSQLERGGEWLRRQRERMGMTQRDVDRKTGLPAQNVSSLETGKIVKPAMAMECLIGKIYGVSPNQIAEAYDWWHPAEQTYKDERVSYVESVLERLSPLRRDQLLRQMEAMAQLAEREMAK